MMSWASGSYWNRVKFFELNFNNTRYYKELDYQLIDVDQLDNRPVEKSTSYLPTVGCIELYQQKWMRRFVIVILNSASSSFISFLFLFFAKKTFYFDLNRIFRVIRFWATKVKLFDDSAATSATTITTTTTMMTTTATTTATTTTTTTATQNQLLRSIGSGFCFELFLRQGFNF